MMPDEGSAASQPAPAKSPSNLTLGEQLQIIRAPDPGQVSDLPDPATFLGIEDLKGQKERAELESFRQDTGERKKVRNLLFWDVVCLGLIYRCLAFIPGVRHRLESSI
jgi:hypothetical protein